MKFLQSLKPYLATFPILSLELHFLKPEFTEKQRIRPRHLKIQQIYNPEVSKTHDLTALENLRKEVRDFLTAEKREEWKQFLPVNSPLLQKLRWENVIQKGNASEAPGAPEEPWSSH